MRIPRIYKREQDPTIKETIYEVNKLPVAEYEPDVDFDDEKSVNRYIRAIKSSIRGSEEYKRMMRFLKEKCDLNSCFFLPKVKRTRDTNISIEIHHTGLVMEDIIRIVLRKKYSEGEDYDMQSVAEEVMEEHYRKHISLTALSSTAHELIHDDASNLFIPLQMVDFGNSDIFYEKYKKYIPKDTLQKYQQYQILSAAITNIEEILPNYLDRDFIYYKVKDEDVEIPDMKKILEIINLNEND